MLFLRKDFALPTCLNPLESFPFPTMNSADAATEPYACSSNWVVGDSQEMGHVDMIRFQAGKKKPDKVLKLTAVSHGQYGCVDLSNPQKSEHGTKPYKTLSSVCQKWDSPTLGGDDWAFLTRWEGRSHHVRAAPTDFARPPGADGMWRIW